MRPQIKTRNSTKSERRVIEVLKELRKPFCHRLLLLGYEVDFLIGNYIIEIDGRKKQSEKKNRELLEAGFNVIHLSNQQTKERSKLTIYLKNICQQIY